MIQRIPPTAGAKALVPAALALLLATLFLPSPADAGPPYVTDDPEVVDYQHAEINFFSLATEAKGGMGGILPGVDANYGLLPGLQIHLQPQVNYGGGSPYNYGDTELGAKYQLLAETPSLPLVSVYPLLEIPGNRAGNGFGAGDYRAFFPVWIEKNFGPWQTFGGGGYWSNPGTGNKNYGFAGWVLQRKLTADLQLGGEIFNQTASANGGKDSSGFNLGGTYDLNQSYHLLFSAGRGIQEANDTNQFSYYVALQWVY